MQRACVIGWPVRHSRSPLIHNYWIRQHRLDARYDRVAVTAAGLPQFVASIGRDGLRGCNVTIPHKQAAYPLVRPVDELTRRLRTVNTIFEDRGTLWGANTDGYGFIASLKSVVPDFEFAGCRCIVLGAGGAARAIVVALMDLGVKSVTVVNRTPDRIFELKRDLDPDDRISAHGFEDFPALLGHTGLLVNATSLGMAGQPALAVALDGLPAGTVVADIVYVPIETNFLSEAKRNGATVVDGLGMLLHQAIPGFRYWFGIEPVVTPELRNRVVDSIAREQASAS